MLDEDTGDRGSDDPQPSRATRSGADDEADMGELALGTRTSRLVDVERERSSIVSRRTMTQCPTVRDRDDGRARRVVVLAGQRPAVGAGAGHGDQVARADIAGEPPSSTTMSPLAMLPTTRTTTGGASLERLARVAE